MVGSRLLPVADERWPAWARALRSISIESDLGIGDTIARVIGPVGGDAFKAWRISIGKPCACKLRQERLNARFPYNHSRTSVISDTSVASQTANNESLDSVRD
jgi:hypothetical protein